MLFPVFCSYKLFGYKHSYSCLLKSMCENQYYIFLKLYFILQGIYLKVKLLHLDGGLSDCQQMLSCPLLPSLNIQRGHESYFYLIAGLDLILCLGTFRGKKRNWRRKWWCLLAHKMTFSHGLGETKANSGWGSSVDHGCEVGLCFPGEACQVATQVISQNPLWDYHCAMEYVHLKNERFILRLYGLIYFKLKKLSWK